MAGETQRIARLTPLSEVLARIDALLTPVAPRRVETQAALGRVLAEGVVAAVAVPAVARALRDGFAVASEVVLDASAYAPVPLSSPQPVVAGDAVPENADAIAALDAVAIRDGQVAAVAPIAPGEGVLAAGADIAAGTVLRQAGEMLRAADIAVLAAAGIGDVSLRAPRVGVVPTRLGDAVIDGAVRVVSAAVVATGAALAPVARDLTTALADTNADAVIAIGGTGAGRNDASVRRLADRGRVEVHGVALSPGETTAFGMVGQRPVLVIPGRIDAALAAWLTLG